MFSHILKQILSRNQEDRVIPSDPISKDSNPLESSWRDNDKNEM